MNGGKRRKNAKRWKRRNARKRNGRNLRGKSMKGRSDGNARIKRGGKKRRPNARRGEIAKKRTKRRENVMIADGNRLKIIYIPL